MGAECWMRDSHTKVSSKAFQIVGAARLRMKGKKLKMRSDKKVSLGRRCMRVVGIRMGKQEELHAIVR